MTTSTTTSAPKSTELTKASKDLSELVNKRITEMANNGSLQIAPNYSAANAIKYAVIMIQDDPKLAECSDSSKAQALLKMVTKGLNPIKNQCYFIPYGGKVVQQDSYFGKQAMALRTGKLVSAPKAQVIYADDIFEFEIDPETGYQRVVKHEQRLQNIDNNKIIGAYAICRFTDGTSDTTIMTLQEIQNSWNQGQMKGKSGAHVNFKEEMCKKTVLGRALKNFLNSSDDAYLFDEDENVPNYTQNASESPLPEFVETEVVEVTDEPESTTQESANDPF